MRIGFNSAIVPAERSRWSVLEARAVGSTEEGERGCGCVHPLGGSEQEESVAAWSQQDLNGVELSPSP